MAVPAPWVREPEILINENFRDCFSSDKTFKIYPWLIFPHCYFEKVLRWWQSVEGGNLK